jgi:PKD repeat protein
LRVHAGSASPYDETLIGTHVFIPDFYYLPSSMIEGITKQPVGTWAAFTSDDLKALLPPGTTGIRIELMVDGGGVYGWGRVDNVRIVTDDGFLPATSFTATPSTGHAPFASSLSGSCSDSDGSCVLTAWDFGDGNTDIASPGGGSTDTALSTSFNFSQVRTYFVSMTSEDDRGGAHTTLTQIQATNTPPTASPSATPAVGPAPLSVAFAANASDSDGTVASYAWDFRDGGSSTIADPTHVFSDGSLHRCRHRHLAHRQRRLLRRCKRLDDGWNLRQ